MENIMQQAEIAIKEAGKFFLDTTIDANGITEKKGTANYVTQVDYLVQEFLLEKLNGIIPGSNVITEESSENIFNLDRPTWILDPVDGTTNLMYGYRHSAISLALFLEGKPAMGIVYNPTADEMFAGGVGKGAYLNGKSICVSANSSLKDCVISFGTTPYYREKADVTFDILKNAFLNSRDIRRSGSAALDVAYVACGRTDGFFELNLQPWDYAAGMIILREAGGVITDWNGDGPSVLSSDSILATNGLIHQSMMELVNKHPY